MILTARDVHKAEELAAELRKASHTAAARAPRSGRSDEHHEAAEQLTKTFDHLDVLVNNASSFPTSALVQH